MIDIRVKHRSDGKGIKIRDQGYCNVALSLSSMESNAVGLCQRVAIVIVIIALYSTLHIGHCAALQCGFRNSGPLRSSAHFVEPLTVISR